MVGDGFHLVLEAMPVWIIWFSPDGRRQAGVTQMRFEAAGDEMLAIEVIEKLPQPVEEKILPRIRRQANFKLLACLDRSRVLEDDREECLAGFDKKAIEIRRSNPQSQVCRVFEGLIHEVDATARPGGNGR